LTDLQELDYRPDSARWFRNLLGLPWCVFLDSARGSFGGRYDVIAADPFVTLTTRGEVTEIRSRRGTASSREDPLELLRRHLGELVPPQGDLPFSGGAIGCFAYDLGRRFERLPAAAPADVAFPDMAVGIYDWAFVVDHLKRRSYLVRAGRDDAVTLDRWRELLQAGEQTPSRPPPAFQVVSDVRSNFERKTYGVAFAAAQDYIRRGDCYQVNLAQRFDAGVRGDGWAAYEVLRSVSPAPFSAFVRTPYGEILSSSPEGFLRLKDRNVETRPIKGTRPRSKDEAEDRRMRQMLADSAKDRAENVMIVDLLRNDLGKTCEPGSVTVDRLFEIESFSNVHHMISTVSGRLREDRHPLDLVRGCFPGGSITGAPKLRAMQIIDELEPHRRNVYCGSIGYLGFDGQMDLNVAIRTLLREGGSIYAWAGGGIVADSDVDAEYQESLDKAQGLLTVLSGSAFSAAG
jgi:para-aminobenzoate synthetase component 1